MKRQTSITFDRFCGSLFVLLLFGLSVLFSGCGGGGGNSSTNNNNNNGTTGTNGAYSGIISEVPITSSNAVDVVKSAYEEITSASQYGVLSAEDEKKPVSEEVSARVTINRLNISILNFLYNKVRGHSMNQVPAVSSAEIPLNQTIDGTCGGNMTYTGTVSDAGSSTGKFTYNNYCVAGELTNGTISFTGTMDLSTETSTMNMTYDLQVTVDGQSWSWTGTSQIITSVTSSGATSITFNYGDVYSITSSGGIWLNNFSETMNFDTSGGYTYSMSGRIYNEGYGYIDMTTVVPLQEDLSTGGITSGQLLFTGYNGSKALLIFSSGDRCQVKVDANNDGTYEWISSYYSW